MRWLLSVGTWKTRLGCVFVISESWILRNSLSCHHRSLIASPNEVGHAASLVLPFLCREITPKLRFKTKSSLQMHFRILAVRRTKLSWKVKRGCQSVSLSNENLDIAWVYRVFLGDGSDHTVLIRYRRMCANANEGWENFKKHNCRNFSRTFHL